MSDLARIGMRDPDPRVSILAHNERQLRRGLVERVYFDPHNPALNRYQLTAAGWAHVDEQRGGP